MTEINLNLGAPIPRNDVLLVDDDPLVNRAMQLLLKRNGFEPIIRTKGIDAIEAARRNISIAVIDIHLPDMSGLDLSRKLRRILGPDALIVILSGDNSIETLRELPQTGATYFFAKPVNGSRLVHQLKEWIEQKRASKPSTGAHFKTV